MLGVLAGTGLMFLIMTVIFVVYTSVNIVEIGTEEGPEKKTTAQIALIVLGFIGVMLLATLIFCALGWLIVQPLMPIFLTCG